MVTLYLLAAAGRREAPWPAGCAGPAAPTWPAPTLLHRRPAPHMVGPCEQRYRYRTHAQAIRPFALALAIHRAAAGVASRKVGREVGDLCALRFGQAMQIRRQRSRYPETGDLPC